MSECGSLCARHEREQRARVESQTHNRHNPRNANGTDVHVTQAHSPT